MTPAGLTGVVACTVAGWLVMGVTSKTSATNTVKKRLIGIGTSLIVSNLDLTRTSLACALFGMHPVLQPPCFAYRTAGRIQDTLCVYRYGDHLRHHSGTCDEGPTCSFRASAAESAFAGGSIARSSARSVA